MTDSRVDLETQLAFLDDMVQTLNDSVSRHEQVLERLERALASVETELRVLTSEQAGEGSGDESGERPPHY